MFFLTNLYDLIFDITEKNANISQINFQTKY